jgi:hypothetical protein
MGHENNGLRAMVNGVFDCWDSSGDTLGIRDLLVCIERDIEVDLVRSHPRQ